VRPQLIPNRSQDEPNSLVFFSAGGVARRSQIAADMLPPRALPAKKNPARLRRILKANWNWIIGDIISGLHADNLSGARTTSQERVQNYLLDNIIMGGLTVARRGGIMVFILRLTDNISGG
jgi:hypothetical protein